MVVSSGSSPEGMSAVMGAHGSRCLVRFGMGVVMRALKKTGHCFSIEHPSPTALQAWAEAIKGVRGGRLDWPVFLTALGASACPVQARAELASFIRLLASGVRPAAPHALLSLACTGLRQ